MPAWSRYSSRRVAPIGNDRNREKSRFQPPGPRNWFRPSYRSRPVRAWFHLRADPFGEIDPALPVAIALLGPIHGRTLDLLCVDQEEAFVTTVAAKRIVAVSPGAAWYPFGAGCYGAEMVICM